MTSGVSANITTVDEFKEWAFAIQKRSRRQTQEDVIALKKKYERPILGEIAMERLLELQAQIMGTAEAALLEVKKILEVGTLFPKGFDPQLVLEVADLNEAEV